MTGEAPDPQGATTGGCPYRVVWKLQFHGPLHKLLLEGAVTEKKKHRVRQSKKRGAYARSDRQKLPPGWKLIMPGEVIPWSAEYQARVRREMGNK